METIPIPKTFEAACSLIRGASSPQALFGVCEPGSPAESKQALESIKKTFRALALIVHPDKNPKDKAKAEAAFKKLEDLRVAAETIYKPESEQVKPVEFTPVTLTTAKCTYVITAKKTEGTMCGIFTGVAQTDIATATGKVTKTLPVVFKIPHTANDNDLMEREAKAYGAMKKKMKEIAVDADGKKIAEKFLMRIPSFLESIQIEEPNVPKKKVVNIFARTFGFETGWFTLEEIRTQYPQGVSTRIMCFIMNRVLEGLTLAHMSGVVHCAITPNHVLIQAREHLGNIVDWTGAICSGTNDGVVCVDEQRYDGYFPEEMIDQQGTPTPATDIYMLAWSMVYLLGGDPKKRLIPNTVETPILGFLNSCLQPNRRFRPQDAAIAYKQFQQISKDVFGPRTFVGLTMP